MRTKKKSRLPAIILAILLLILVAAGTYLAVTWPGPSRLLPVAAHAVYKRPDWAPRDRNVELLQYDKQAAIRAEAMGTSPKTPAATQSYPKTPLTFPYWKPGENDTMCPTKT